MLLNGKNKDYIFSFIQSLKDEIDYISYDLEFGGLLRKHFQKKIFFLSPIHEIYTAVKDAASYYSILQVGVTIFYSEMNQKKYFSFSFYPNNSEDIQLNRNAIQFLLNNKFNFQTLFTHQMKSRKIKICDFDDNDPKNFIVCNTFMHFEKIKETGLFEMNDKYENFFKDLARSYNNFKDCQNFQKEYDIFENIVYHIELFLENKMKYSKDSSELHQELMYQYGKIKNSIFTFIVALTKQTNYVLNKSKDSMFFELIEIYNTETKEHEENKLSKGFKICIKKDIKMKEVNKNKQIIPEDNIVKYLLSLGKPNILHSCMFDMMYLWQNFFGQLPEKYYEFSEIISNISENFVLFDTKKIINSNELKESFSQYYGFKYIGSLSDMFNHLSNNTDLRKDFENIEGKLVSDMESNGIFCFTRNDDNAHDAEFDSYMTGILFHSIDSYVRKNSISLDWEVFKNKIFLYNSYIDFIIGKETDKVIEYYSNQEERIEIIEDPNNDFELALRVENYCQEKNFEIINKSFFERKIYLLFVSREEKNNFKNGWEKAEIKRKKKKL